MFTTPVTRLKLIVSKKLKIGMSSWFRTALNSEDIFAKRCDFASRSCTLFRLTSKTRLSRLRILDAVLAMSAPL